ncbi:SAM-dependent methyltransferase [Methylophilaceae bacterium]|jgi:16S rRNA (cytidine1402-2'-O)-methyltransferase|nr:SAM-dependent methyltransferase [Methylophilaceae bacterium]
MAVKSNNLGILFIIPSSIDQNENISFLLDEQSKMLHNIKYFIVENEKIARKTIKELKLKTEIQSVTLLKHNNKTSTNDLKEYFNPIYSGNDIGLLSDSGSPCIADPGSKIVEYAHLNNIKIQPLVGPSSIILSLMASGFNGQKFKFHGYIPIDKIDKELYIKKMASSIKEEKETQIFIETPYRNERLFNDLLKILDKNIRLCLAINLTSSKEEIISDSIENWRLKKNINIDKQLCIFLIN